ncbi:hypothetical protein [Micromonospora sp. bgisy143]|uniref:hypothetical protein n=1 Tax=Micromonospora sp. bgisy143 TaxID=3413790 RepID=UPI003EBE65E0
MSLPQDVQDRLRVKGPEFGRYALILPVQTRNGRTYYLADDVEALRAARTAGLEAEYLVNQAERRYLNEFATGWELELALAVAQNLAANGIGAVIGYVWARVRFSIKRGHHPGPETEVPVRLKIAQVERDEQGAIKIEGIEINGTAEGATALLGQILVGPVTTTMGLASRPVDQPVDDQGEDSTAP